MTSTATETDECYTVEAFRPNDIVLKGAEGRQVFIEDDDLKDALAAADYFESGIKTGMVFARSFEDGVESWTFVHE